MSIWIDGEGRYHVGIMVAGQRIHRRMPQGSTKGDAKALEAELRRAIGRREPMIPGDPPLADIMDLYLSHATHLRSPQTARHHALRAGPWIIGKRASEAPSAAARMIEDMAGHYKPATINRTLGTIKKALTLAYSRGDIPADYGDKIRRLPENNEVHFYWTPQQVKHLADHCSEPVRAAIWISLLTGCRRGEALKLTRADIGRDTITLKAGNTKTLRERTVPIVPALRPWLRHVPIAITFEGLKTAIRRAREAAGMPEFTFHQLRHSCASILVNEGVALHVIRDILGHSSVRTTERYSHLAVDHTRDALKLLSRKVGRNAK